MGGSKSKPLNHAQPTARIVLARRQQEIDSGIALAKPSVDSINAPQTSVHQPNSPHKPESVSEILDAVPIPPVTVSVSPQTPPTLPTAYDNASPLHPDILHQLSRMNLVKDKKVISVLS
jgi:hypothetical protein